MGGNKHKQTKKKPAKLVRDSKNKKDPSGADQDQTDPSLDPGHHCCLPVGKFDLRCAPFCKCLTFPRLFLPQFGGSP